MARRCDVSEGRSGGQQRQFADAAGVARQQLSLPDRNELRDRRSVYSARTLIADTASADNRSPPPSRRRPVQVKPPKIACRALA
jgi:hypothetical protein